MAGSGNPASTMCGKAPFPCHDWQRRALSVNERGSFRTKEVAALNAQGPGPSMALKNNHSSRSHHCEIERKTVTGFGRYIRIKRPTAASKGSSSAPRHIRLVEAYIVKASLGHASTGLSNGPPVPLLSPQPHPKGPPIRQLASRRLLRPTQIQNALPVTNARLAKDLSVTGATRAACRIRRSCSASVWPSG